MKYLETPIQEVRHEVFEKAGVRVLIKREDLNHPLISGNKWWKLKYNLRQAKESGFTQILTFGGAHSNHIYATAAAAVEHNLKAIGVIRGERHINPTLRFAEQNGMALKFISREQYRLKTTEAMIKQLQSEFGDFFLIPEGGTNQLAIKGCAEFAMKKLASVEFDKLFIAVGTGGTIAGIVCGLDSSRQVVGVSVLKNGEFLCEEVNRLTLGYDNEMRSNWSLLTTYAHGGYAKTTPALLELITNFGRQNLPLDHVYNAKMMFAIIQEIQVGNIQKGSTVLAIHTGGLQGAMTSPEKHHDSRD